MSRDLLMTVGGMISDHNFRDRLFGGHADAALGEFKVKNPTALAKVYRVLEHPEKERIRRLMAELEPYICGADLDDCEIMKPVPADEPVKTTST